MMESMEELDEHTTRKSGVEKKLNQRLNLKTGIIPSMTLIFAALLLNLDLSWLRTGKVNQLSGKVVEDLQGQLPHKISNKRPLANIKVQVYSDINANKKKDKDDILLESTLSDNQGRFELELPTVNTLEIKAEKVEPHLSWDKEKELNLHFSAKRLANLKRIKKIYLEIRSEGDFEEFASSQVMNPAKEGGKIIWDHKPWVKDRIYQSPDLRKILTDQVVEGIGLEDIDLLLSFRQAGSARKVQDQIYLNIQFENSESDYLVLYEKKYLTNGLPIMGKLLVNNGDQFDLELPYAGKSPQCLGLNRLGDMAYLNRFSKQKTYIKNSGLQLSGLAPTLIPDPLSGSWLALENGLLLQWNPQTERIAKTDLSLPFCMDNKSCFLSYTYHPLLDEILVLDKDYKLWSFPLNRDEGEIEPADPILLSEWSGAYIPGTRKLLRMTLDPIGEEIYFLTESKNKSIELNKIGLDGSKYRPLGPIHSEGENLKYITGLQYRPNGELWILSQEKSSKEQKIFRIDPEFQLLKQISSIELDQNLSACACMPKAPYQLSIQVFDDQNLNERRDEGERLIQAVKVKGRPYQKEETAFRELKANKAGDFLFRTYQEGLSEVILDEENLPEGYSINNTHSLILPNDAIERKKFPTGDQFAISHISKNPYIRWAGIRAEVREGGVQLEWATSKEINARTFQVLRSEDGIHYEEVGGVEPVGNSKEMQEYEYKDYLIDDLETPVIAYRIKMKGKNGEISYSPVSKILISEPNEGLDLAVRVHPSNESVKLSYQVLKPGPSEIRILNLTGNVMKTIPVGLSRNGDDKEVEVKGWAKGMYYAQLRNGEYSVMKRWILK